MMKRQAFILASLIISCMQVAHAEIYTIDPKHSYVSWRISHFDFSHPTGKWFAEGTIDMDEKNPSTDKVDVTIEVPEMVTGQPDLDKHLKAEQFFNIQEFPKATFVSNKIDYKDNKPVKVHGTLTLRGVSKPVTLDVKMNKKGINPINNTETIGFSAQGKVKRSDFGMNALLPGLGDNVDLSIEVEAAKK